MKTDHIPGEPYVILASDRVLLGMRVRGDRAADLIDKYSPTSVLPDAWTPFPVARNDR